MIQVGCKGHAALRVTTENTARAMGSGELPVLATPAVAALVEKDLLAGHRARTGAGHDHRRHQFAAGPHRADAHRDGGAV